MTGNTGGYLLVTGELDEENEFRLHKYFAQILAGVAADSIVVDPRASIGPGETQQTPFYINEADSRFGAVLLTRFPVLRFTLEAPDGTRIEPANVAGFNGQFVQGRQCRYFLITLPAFPGGVARNRGKWHTVVTYPGRRPLDHEEILEGRLAAAGRKDKRPPLNGFNMRRGYNVLVRARSSIQIESRVDQRGFGPVAERQLITFVKGFGLPLDRNINLVAQITRPDGVITMLPLARAGNGRFEAKLDDAKLFGTYQIVVRASGQTPGNWPLQREQTITGIVIDPTAKTDADVRNEELRDTLKELAKKQEEQLRNLGRLLEQLVRIGGGKGMAFPRGCCGRCSFSF